MLAEEEGLVGVEGDDLVVVGEDEVALGRTAPASKRPEAVARDGIGIDRLIEVDADRRAGHHAERVRRGVDRHDGQLAGPNRSNRSSDHGGAACPT